jgi:hypothetical protein
VVDPARRRALGAFAFAVFSGCTRSAPESREHPTSEGTVQIRVPAALRLERSLTNLTVGFDSAARAPVVVALDSGMILGVETMTFVFTASGTRPAAGRRGLSSGADFDGATSTWSIGTDGIPRPGSRYVAEVEVTVFETDVTPGHHWEPHAGRYKALWTRTLRQAEE